MYCVSFTQPPVLLLIPSGGPSRGLWAARRLYVTPLQQLTCREVGCLLRNYGSQMSELYAKVSQIFTGFRSECCTRCFHKAYASFNGPVFCILSRKAYVGCSFYNLTSFTVVSSLQTLVQSQGCQLTGLPQPHVTCSFACRKACQWHVRLRADWG